jgi:PIN domain
MEKVAVGEKITIRAVVDTSSLFPSNLRKNLQDAAELGAFTAIWSPWIIAELNRVLVWRWIKNPPQGLARNDLSKTNKKYCDDAAKEMMKHLLPVFELVDPRPPYPPAWPTLADEWDIPIWAAAKIGNAQYVISENTRDYPPRQPDSRYLCEEIEYVGGYAFLDMLERMK